MSVDGRDGAALIATGRTADVFALGDGRVLRRYRDGADASAEAQLMGHVVRHGYPVPAVIDAAGPDLVMELLQGPTMAEAILAGDLDVGDAGRMLGDLHDRLHQIPGRTEGSRVLHLDLHPLNVIVLAGGPVVIDWANAMEGDPALDVAMTALILAQVAVGHVDALAVLARELLRAFLTAVHEDAVSRLDDAVRQRRHDPHVTTVERERLGDAAALVRTCAQA